MTSTSVGAEFPDVARTPPAPRVPRYRSVLMPLSFLLSRLLNQLCERLAARALAAIEIRIALKLENKPEHARAIRLPVPMRDVKTLLKLLQLELTAHPPEAPIMAVRLDAEAARPRAMQGGLYTPPSPEPAGSETHPSADTPAGWAYYRARSRCRTGRNPSPGPRSCPCTTA